MNEIVIYYSKVYRFWWSIILSSIALSYILFFFFVDIEVYFLFHIFSAIYFSLIVWSTYRPYLKIRNGKIWTTRYLFSSLNEKDLKEVILNDENYIFKLKSHRFFVGINFIEEADNEKLKKFLRDRSILVEPETLF